MSVAAAAAAARARYAAMQAEAGVAGWGPVFVAKSRSYKVRQWEVFVPQADPRFVGAVPVSRHATQEEAQAAADALLAANTYALDAQGWWRLAR